MAKYRVKKVGLWGAYWETVWYDGPDDHYLVVARTSDQAVITFEHENAPVKLREWLYRGIFKVASDYDLVLTRKGDRLYAPLEDLQKVVNIAYKASGLVRVSEGAKAYLKAAENTETEESKAASRTFLAALEKTGFGHGSSES